MHGNKWRHIPGEHNLDVHSTRNIYSHNRIEADSNMAVSRHSVSSILLLRLERILM